MTDRPTIWHRVALWLLWLVYVAPVNDCDGAEAW